MHDGISESENKAAGIIYLAAPIDCSMQYILVIPDSSIILNNKGPLTLTWTGYLQNRLSTKKFKLK